MVIVFNLVDVCYFKDGYIAQKKEKQKQKNLVALNWHLVCKFCIFKVGFQLAKIFTSCVHLLNIVPNTLVTFS